MTISLLFKLFLYHFRPYSSISGELKIKLDEHEPTNGLSGKTDESKEVEYEHHLAGGCFSRNLVIFYSFLMNVLGTDGRKNRRMDHRAKQC